MMICQRDPIAVADFAGCGTEGGVVGWRWCGCGGNVVREDGAEEGGEVVVSCEAVGF